MTRSVGISSLHVAIAAAVLRAGVAGASPTVDFVSIGPSSMEGSIQISNGDWVNGGYSMKSTVAGDLTIEAKVTITGPCSNGGTDTVTVPLAPATYHNPSGASDWLPTSDANSPLSWQGSVQVGVNSPSICGGAGMLDARSGAILTATISANPPEPGSTVTFRFKYRDPAAKAKPNTNCLDTSDPNRAKADVCGASWSETATHAAGGTSAGGTVCISTTKGVACGPFSGPDNGSPGNVCISTTEGVVCGPVSVCVTNESGFVCGPATGPGSNPGEVCLGDGETVFCGAVAGSGPVPGSGSDSGDVCITSGEVFVCGAVAPTAPETSPGDVCVWSGEALACGSVPTTGFPAGSGSGSGSGTCVPSGEGDNCDTGSVLASSSSGAGTSAANGTATSGGTSTVSSTRSNGGCAAFPGADLSVGVLALLGLSLALRRRR